MRITDITSLSHMMFSLSLASVPLPLVSSNKLRPFKVVADAFPSFLPNQVETIQDPLARKFAMRIQRLPVPVNNIHLHFLFYFIFLPQIHSLFLQG